MSKQHLPNNKRLIKTKRLRLSGSLKIQNMQRLTVILFVLLSIPSIGQDLYSSIAQTDQFLWRITEAEAKQIHQSEDKGVSESFFHTLIDTIPIGKNFVQDYNSKLPSGHYIVAGIKGEYLNWRYFANTPFRVDLVENNTELVVLVKDENGIPIKNATVLAKNRKLNFNRKAEAYLSKSNFKSGELSVEVNGHRAFYQIVNKEKKDKQLSWRKILYGRPQRFVVLPIRYVLRLPFDGVKSIVKKRPEGVLYTSKYKLRKFFRKIDCLFTDKPCKEKNYRGYLVSSKPKYKLNDTLKIKGYLTDFKGRPLKDELTVYISGGIHKSFEKIKPIRPGVYIWKLILDKEKYKLKLDKSYWVNLKIKNRTVKSCQFMLEQYDLNSLTLSVNASSDTHYKGDDFYLNIEGKDENELRLVDGKVKVKLRTKNINQFLEDSVFVPNLLLDTTIILRADSTTKFQISDSLFPKADLAYSIEVELLNSDQQLKKQTLVKSFKHNKPTLKFFLEEDSLNIQFINKSSAYSEFADIFVIKNGQREILKNINIPIRLKISPEISSYEVKSTTINQRFNLFKANSNFSFSQIRHRDSIELFISNPRKLAFSYFIYKGNTEEGRGFGKKDRLVIPARNKKNYVVTIQYVWGGQIKNNHYGIPYKDRQIDLLVDIPKRIVPGQVVEVEVTAIDQKKKPMVDIDLLAYSYTDKFKKPSNKITPVPRKKKGKKIKRNFKFNQRKTSGAIAIPYKNWNSLTHIDTIAFYQLRFPEDSLYRTEYLMADSITQIAPFVSKDGILQKVHVISIDNRPAYFSWSSATKPYSFKTTPGRHNITIRTKDRSIKLNNVDIRAYHKNIISVDLNKAKRDVAQVIKMPDELTSKEYQNYNKFNLFYRHNYRRFPAYLHQEDELFILPPSRNTSKLVGPILPRYIRFEYLDQFKHEFLNETGFSFEFEPNLLRLRQVGAMRGKYGNFTIQQTAIIPPLEKDRVKTLSHLEEWKRNYYLTKRKNQFKFSFKAEKDSEKGTLQFKGVERIGKTPINVFFFKKGGPEEFNHLPGYSSKIPNLEIGVYNFIFLYRDKSYLKSSNIHVKAKGINYYNFSKTELLPADEYSSKVDSIIQSAVEENAKELTDFEMRTLYEHLQSVSSEDYDGEYLYGKVSDKLTKEGLIGANVIVYSNNQFLTGTSTDLEGNYRIKLPDGYYTVEAAYIGYPSEKFSDVTPGFFPLNIALDYSNSITLDEVIVTGLGVSRSERSLGYSVSSVKAEDIRNIPRKNISALAARSAGISITNDQISIVGSRNEGTHYYIDGIRVQGNNASYNSNEITDIKVVEGAEALEVYGAEKVVLLTSKAYEDSAFYQASMSQTGLRNNFSDEGFWEPDIITDQNGKAKLKVTFPDDITKWDVHFLAAKGKYAGYQNAKVKAYKPISGNLALPKFITTSDTAMVIGKTANYTNDSLQLNSLFEAKQGEEVLEKKENVIILKEGHVAKYSINAAKSDSIAVTYQVKRADGYFDGEQRTIPVLQTGLEIAKGSFEVLDRDTTFDFISTSDSEVKIYFDTDQLNILRRELGQIKDYKYYCNEQLASKLLAQLNDKILAEFLEEKFEGEIEIIKMLNELHKRRNKDGLWGWWSGNNTSGWISSHVIKALIKARKMGYTVKLDGDEIGPRLIYFLELSTDIKKFAQHLQSLRALEVDVDYDRYLNKLDTLKSNTLYESLLRADLQLEIGSSPDTSWMETFRKTTIFGNIYYQDTIENRSRYHLFNNSIQESLLAYKIIKRGDSEKVNKILSKMRNYFFQIRRKYNWRNTHEAISIVQTIIPDMLTKGKVVQSAVQLSGAIDTTIRKFPFSIETKLNVPLEISKAGKFPVYFTSYTNHWIESPESKSDIFKISTQIDTSSQTNVQSKLGEKLNLKVDLQVLKTAEYVMIEIPIPAGCTFDQKRKNWRYEVHREYYDDKVVIFCRRLPEGNFEFNIDLFTKFSGSYQLNPAKASLMYFPTFYGNNESKRLEID